MRKVPRNVVGRRPVTPVQSTVAARLAALRARGRRSAAPDFEKFDEMGDEPIVDAGDVEFMDEDLGDLGDLGDFEPLDDMGDEPAGDCGCPVGQHSECVDDSEEEGEEPDADDKDKDDDKEDKKEKKDKDDDKEDDDVKDDKEDKKDDKEKDASVAERLARFTAMRDARRAATAAKVLPAKKPTIKTAEPVVAPPAAVVPVTAAPTDTAPVVEPEEDKIAWSPLVTESMLADVKDPEVDLTLKSAGTNPYYVLWINEKPVGELHEADLNLDDAGKDVFRSAQYVKGVRDVVQQFGAVAALQDLKLRYYAANTQENDAIKRAKAEIAQDADQAFRKRVATMVNDMFSTMNLAFQASQKNFILQNALKDAVVENFRSAGVPEGVAIDLIEDAFTKAGPEYFKAMLDKTQEWLGYEPEALRQIEAEVTAMQYRHPREQFGNLGDDIPAVQVPRAANVVARTAQTVVEDDLDTMMAAARRVGREVSTRR